MTANTISYFPELEVASKTPASKQVKQKKSSTSTSQSIQYFPTLDESGVSELDIPAIEKLEEQIADDVPVQSLTKQIQETLLQNGDYAQAIAKLSSLQGNAKNSSLENLLQLTIKTAIATTIKETEEDIHIPSKFSRETQIADDEYPETLSPENIKQAQCIRLKEIGRLLRKVREKREVSLNALYQKTHILSSHIRAIESGDLDALPESLYVKSFIRHLGDALGINGTAVAARFPVLDSFAGKRNKGNGLSSNHWSMGLARYVGYGALVMGGVSSLSWSLSQSQRPSIPLTPVGQMDHELTNNDEIQPVAVQSQRNVAPPERMNVQ